MWHFMTVGITQRFRHGSAGANPTTISTLTPSTDNERNKDKGLNKPEHDPAPDRRFRENIIDKNKSFEKKIRLDFKNLNNFIKEMRFIRKLFKKPNHKIKILEFGCGWGFWARLAKSLNFKVDTIEISKSRIKFLNQNGIENRKKFKIKLNMILFILIKFLSIFHFHKKSFLIWSKV